MRTTCRLLAFACVLGLAAGIRAEGRREVDLGGLKSAAPADWKAQKPSSRMRLYQFELPGEKGAAELSIFSFPGGQGGTADANVKRWKGMFVPPEGKSIDDVSKVDHFDVGEAKVTYVDVSGTYKYKERPFDPQEKPQLKSDYRMLGVVMDSKGGPFFLRLVGPAATIEQHKKSFDDWLKAFK